MIFVALDGEEEGLKGAEAFVARPPVPVEKMVLNLNLDMISRLDKGEGDAKASQLYAGAFGQDPQFAQFYRSLEAYRATFRNRGDVMVVDPSADFFKYLKGATPGAVSAPARPSAGNASDTPTPARNVRREIPRD